MVVLIITPLRLIFNNNIDKYLFYITVKKLAETDKLNWLASPLARTPQSCPPIETLWCKNHENPSDRKSLTGAPLTSLHSLNFKVGFIYLY
jgi:hypothetical protein